MKYIIIILAVLIGYFFPKEYGSYLSKKYREDFVSFPLAVLTAIVAVAGGLLLDEKGFWFWFLFVVFVLVCIYIIALIIYKGVSVNANPFEIFLAVLAQVVAAVGVFFLILLLLSALFGTKKRKH